MSDATLQGCRHSLAFKILDLLSILSYRVAPWALLALVFYFFRQIVIGFEEGRPGLEMWIGIMTNVTRTRIFAFIFGFAGMLYGLQQRNLRRAESERLQKRIAELEGGRER